MDPAVTFLLGSQSQDGGWGYSHGDVSFVEPTAIAILALKNINEAAAACQAGIAWLVHNQNPDGGWGVNGEDQQSIWQTAWAVQALVYSPEVAESCRKGIDWLWRFEPFQITDAAQLEMGEKVASIDFSLRGWPWLPGESSWIEPTALVIWTLAAAGVADENRSRLEEAVRYMQDRRCNGGGWNVGNPVMFEASLPARAQPTAWVLLALARYAPAILQDDDVQSMLADMQSDEGPMALAWSCLALTVLNIDHTELVTRLLSLQSEEGSWGGSIYQTVVAALALQEGSI